MTSAWAAGAPACSEPIPDALVSLGSARNLEHVRKSATEICSGGAVGSTVEVLQHESGRVKAVSCIGPAGPEGPSLTWHENGQLASRGRLTSAGGEPELCGRWSRYFDNGELRDEGEWVDGVPAGLWKIRAETGAPLGERAFDAPFIRHNEWAVVGGLTYITSSNDGPGSTPVPGPSFWVRRGVQWLRWLYLEVSVGVDAVARIKSGSPPFEFDPVTMLTLDAYWTPANSRMRLGLQAGGALSTKSDSDGGKKEGPLHPMVLAVLQYTLTDPKANGAQWFVEVGTLPPVGFFIAHLLIGKRW